MFCFECDPEFVMHWAEDIHKTTSDDGKTAITVWAGSLQGVSGLNPPTNSWAADAANNVGIFFLQIQPGASYSLPKRSGVTRNAYFIEGSSLLINDDVILTFQISTNLLMKSC